jgi:hypothetical protein
MKKSVRTLLYILSGLILFTGFIYYLQRPSTFSIVKKRLAACTTITDVKSIWDQYRYQFTDKPEFADICRKKLNELGLTQTELCDVKQWMPAKTNNINLIIIPDLSRRIIDSINNPGQIRFDTTLLSSIWRAFESKTRLKMNSKDRLIIDITDPDQGQGNFSRIANDLVFDLSEHRNQSNRIYFAKNSSRFHDKVAGLYTLAAEKTTGADYSYYFSQKITSRQKKSTLDDNYRNVVIIITDGYLEVTRSPNRAESLSPSPELLKQFCTSGNSSSFAYPLNTIGLDLSGVEIYLFEFNEKKTGKNCHFTGLKRWWSEWFKLMHVANADNLEVYQHQEAAKLNEDYVHSIFGTK